MWGLMTPAYLIIFAIAAVVSIPVLIAVIGLVTELGKALGF